MDLKNIKQALEIERFVIEYESADSNYPVDRLFLLIELEGRKEEDGLMLEIIEVPEMEKELESLTLLQFFVMLPFETNQMNDDILGDIVQAMLKANTTLPVGSFGFHSDDEYLYFKTMLMIPDIIDKTSQNILIQTSWMISYILNIYLPIFEKIANGEISLDVAYQEIADI